jgi:hypothetical protein
MDRRVASPTFVGRLEELQILEAARVRAATTEPAVVLLGGEAGVGKTRLIAELTARCTTDGTRVLVGGCVPVGGDGLPYGPIVEALRPLLDELGVVTMRELGGSASTSDEPGYCSTPAGLRHGPGSAARTIPGPCPCASQAGWVMSAPEVMRSMTAVC